MKNVSIIDQSMCTHSDIFSLLQKEKKKKKSAKKKKSSKKVTFHLLQLFALNLPPYKSLFFDQLLTACLCLCRRNRLRKVPRRKRARSTNRRRRKTRRKRKVNLIGLIKEAGDIANQFHAINVTAELSARVLYLRMWCECGANVSPVPLGTW